jgi:hypothetical protein
MLLHANAFSQVALQPPGAGTAGDPYLISSVEHLYWLSSTGPKDQYYQQIADINAASTAGWFLGDGFPPVINFSGVYDGGSYKITGLFISANTGAVGLFGSVSGRVSNLIIEDASVTGNAQTGGLAGVCNGCVLEHCSVISSQISGDAEVGGLIGEASNATLSDLLVEDCTITADSYAGGMIGEATNIDITRAMVASTQITVNSESLGGFVANSSQSSYSLCGTNVTLTGNADNAGGFVAHAFELDVYSNCYARGSVSNASLAGGFVGLYSNVLGQETTISHSYAAVSFTGVNTVGGFFASDAPITTQCFWDEDVSGTNAFVNPPVGTLQVVSTATLKGLAPLISGGWDFSCETTNGTQDHWRRNASHNSGYPFFSWEGIAADYVPVEAVANDTTRCSDGNLNFRAQAPTDANIVVQWSDDNVVWGNAGTVSPSFMVTQGNPVTRYVRQVHTIVGCAGPVKTLTASVANSIATPTAANQVRCKNGNVQFTVTSTLGTDEVAEWSLDNNSWGNAGTTSPMYAVNVGSPITRYVRVRNTQTNCISPVLTLSGTALPQPNAPTLSNVTRCGNGNITFTSNTTLAANEQFQWSEDNINWVASGNTSPTYMVSTGQPILISLRVYNTLTDCASFTTTASGVARSLPVTPLVFQNQDTLRSTYVSGNQWLDENLNPISGANSQKFQPANSGTYSVRVTDVHGCQSISAPFTFWPISRSAATLSGVRLFPNPSSSGRFQLALPYADTYKVRVLSLTGQVLHTATTSNTAFSFEGDELPAGIYQVEVSQGRKRQTLKLVVQ